LRIFCSGSFCNRRLHRRRLVLVWAGAALGWRWVRNPWFRYLHLAAIAFVAAEALLGAACPLTVWEDVLRGGLRPESFIGRWAHRLLYYQAPEWISPPAMSPGRSPR